MAQPSGRILGLPAKSSFWLKTSPIVCFANTLAIIASFRVVFRPQWSIRSLIQDKYDNEEEDGAESSLANLQRNTVFQVILFVLGPIAQAAKIFACSGIPWTKLLAVPFLASYVCDELVLTTIWWTSLRTRRGIPNLIESVFDRHAAGPMTPHEPPSLPPPSTATDSTTS